MGLKIRQARKDDLPEILSLLEGLSGTKSNQEKGLKIFNKLLKSGSYFLFVAASDNKVVGTASILLAPSLQHGKVWGLIDNVVVPKDFRRKGIGSKLTRFLINFAKEKDCYKIILSSRFTRRGVHQFWQKLGFKKHGFAFRMDL